MAKTLNDLYLSRCNAEGKPLFWNPQEFVQPVVPRFFGKFDVPDNVYEMIARAIKLGLELELPVGELVLNSFKHELPKQIYTIPLLKSAITDESRHFKGFTYASKAYSYKSSFSFEGLAQDWLSLMSKYHPLQLAAALEIGVFLCSLAAMRIFGGFSLSVMSAAIAQDEYRHTATNASICKGLKLEFPPKELKELVRQTVQNLFEPLNYNGFNVDKFQQYSNELLTDLHSPELDRMLGNVHLLPFENSNKYLYSRTPE
jgi:hypothetical protein